jgi:hypothetical protein
VERASRSPPVQPKTKTKTGNQRIHNNVQAGLPADLERSSRRGNYY